LAALFRNGDTEEDVLAEYAELFAGDNESVGGYTDHEANRIVTNSVGFGGHYSTPEDFMLAVIRAAKSSAEPIGPMRALIRPALPAGRLLAQCRR
jgi:hypothetical protein